MEGDRYGEVKKKGSRSLPSCQITTETSGCIHLPRGDEQTETDTLARSLARSLTRAGHNFVNGDRARSVVTLFSYGEPKGGTAVRRTGTDLPVRADGRKDRFS